MRKETDFLGSIELPDDCLYGINTARAATNFNISDRPVHKELIYELIMLKKAAAIANRDAGLLDSDISEYIAKACDKLVENTDMAVFPVDALQGGAGTSVNMNVNEAVCNTALLLAGRKCGEYSYINPFEHVNLNQSTNDVFTTAVRIASIKLLRKLSDACAELQSALQEKEHEFADVKKIARTELMNATEITLGEHSARASPIPLYLRTSSVMRKTYLLFIALPTAAPPILMKRSRSSALYILHLSLDMHWA